MFNCLCRRPIATHSSNRIEHSKVFKHISRHPHQYHVHPPPRVLLFTGWSSLYKFKASFILKRFLNSALVNSPPFPLRSWRTGMFWPCCIKAIDFYGDKLVVQLNQSIASSRLSLLELFFILYIVTNFLNASITTNKSPTCLRQLIPAPANTHKHV